MRGRRSYLSADPLFTASVGAQLLTLRIAERPPHPPAFATLRRIDLSPRAGRGVSTPLPFSRCAFFCAPRFEHAISKTLPKNDTALRHSSEPFGVDRPNGSRSPRCTNERTEGKNSKEAERRQTRRQKLHLPAQRAPCGARSPVGVPLRLSPGRQLVPKAQRQAMLSGTVRSVRSCTAAPTGERRPCASSRALPAPEQQTNVPVQRAPRVPVIVPAGLMPKPPECGGDEPSARGHRNPLRQPSSPASVLVRERDEFF